MQDGFAIGKRCVGDDAPVFVIAEVGVNHGGDAVLCARMIEAAAASGADAVKLQTIDADESYVSGTASHKEFKGKELDDQALTAMMHLSDRLGIELFSTPGDFSSLARMRRLGMRAVKISSGLMTNTPLIAEAARCGFPLIISTGMGYAEEMQTALDVARANGAPGVALLKCTALYPSPDDTLNLCAIPVMAERFAVPIGYSDHTLDGLACEAAVALGATVIEKHFTLDRTQLGADHHISMEPGPFAVMVKAIRRLEVMRGMAELHPVAEEEQMRQRRHRCLVARRDIRVGEVFDETNVGLKRPLDRIGLPASSYFAILGKTARQAILRDESIIPSCVGGM